ncbi:hypothetical protein KR074_007692, partial [Drosophila pseudoananassae]
PKMVRAPQRKKIRPRRRTVWIEEQEDFDLLTAEEVSQSIQRSSYDWQKPPDTDSDSEIGAYRQPKLHDLSAYGEWRLPDGKTSWDFRQSALELMQKLKAEPYPDIFRPPPLLGTKGAPNQVFNPMPLSPDHCLFAEALPVICARVEELMNPPECEGAVGYDQRYYASSTMVKSLAAQPRRCRLPPAEGNPPGTKHSWMDGRHCARFLVELKKPLVDYQRLRRLPRRQRPQSRPNKLLIGCRTKVKKPPRTYRPLRPRARIILNSESSEEPQQWLEDEEEPEFYFDQDLDQD